VAEDERREVIIKFRDVDGKEVGYEISVDTNSTKADLNKMLNEIIEPEEK
jgi:hypothetical protein